MRTFADSVNDGLFRILRNLADRKCGLLKGCGVFPGSFLPHNDMRQITVLGIAQEYGEIKQGFLIN